MPIKHYTASADNTITNAFKLSSFDSSRTTVRGTGSNAGVADVVEVFSTYGVASATSQELSRILVEFPVASISADRSAGKIPASGSVSFFMKMYNAKHAHTVPENFTLSILPVAQSWQEGTGMDLLGHQDDTKGIPGSNWMSASNTSPWTGSNYTLNDCVGGSYRTGALDPQFKQTFRTGLEDLEIEVTPLVEHWVAGTIDNYGVGIHLTSSQGAYAPLADSATATIQFNSAIAEDYDGETFTVESTDGTEVVYTLDDDASSNTYGASTTNIGIQGMAEAASKAAELVTAAGNNSSNAHYGKITFVEGASATVTLTQVLPGGNNTITTSDSDDITVSGFTGGTSQGAVLPLTGGATFSYYTKRFFARTTEFFYRRPIIEARWDSTRRDDRGDFYYSSSLAPAADNLNTIYLYNYVRGRLRNIPDLGSDNRVYVSIFSGSTDNSEPSGAALILAADNSGYVRTAAPTIVTGGQVATGIYSASFALTAAATPVKTLYDVWFTGSDATVAASSSTATQYSTGSITPNTLIGGGSVRNPTYYLNITNLKNRYNQAENARFNLYVRNKYWNPTIYTKATATVPTTNIISASYSVIRLVDAYVAIPYGTGSILSTGISYDVSGNYFDLDMGLLEAGYGYGFKFAFYDPELNSWIEQDRIFKFRVEEYEY
tara:strand:- start:4612 stop:6600 length:1989 start_codon:yes stop_codon:yes gene_type:complete